MIQTPLEDIKPLLAPLVLKLQEELVACEKILRTEQEKLGDLINNDEDISTQEYEVIFRKADVAYVQFKIDWVKKLLNGKLHG